MKILNFSLAILFLSLLLSSCNKDLGLLNSPLEDMSLNKMQRIVKGFDKQFASFGSEEEFTQFVIGYHRLEDADKQFILAEVEYETFEEFISSKYDELAIAQNEAEELAFLEKNKETFSIKEDNGLFSIDVIDESLHSAKDFFNANRIIKIGELYYKFLGDYSFHSSNIELVNSIKSVKELWSSKLAYEKVVEKVNQSLRTVDVWKKYSYELTSNRCRSRRKVTLAVAVVSTNLPSSTGEPFLSFTLDARAEARRQGWTCSWYLYRTEIDWENIAFKFELDDQFRDMSFSDRNCDSCMRIQISDFFDLNQIIPPLEWKEIHSDITSRGIGDNWLEVDLIF